MVHRCPELTTSPAGLPSPPAARRRRRGRAATVLLILLVGSVTGVLPLNLTRVVSGSMAPTLSAGDLALVTRWHPDVARFDVVVVERPSDGGTGLVKRVVAIAGDTVSIEDGVLVVNGSAVCEPWSDPSPLDGVWHGPVRVPEDAVFLLGDERGGSVDSRSFGPVAEDEVVGLVLARVWPAPGSMPTAVC